MKLLDEEGQSTVTQWLTMFGLAATVCVAVTAWMSPPTPIQLHVATATRPQLAVSSHRPLVRSQLAGNIDGLNAYVSDTPAEQMTFHQNPAGSWLPAFLLVPLSGVLGALAFYVARGGQRTMTAVGAEKDMKVWNPIDNRKFETFSYLPPLTDAQIAKQVDMIIAKGLSPCLEFAPPEDSFTSNENTVRFSGTSAGYYDNRYWTMWKLPMFGCTDASQVLKEVAECRKAYPQCYVRLAAFDSVKQVQVISFLVQRPSSEAMAAVTGEKAEAAGKERIRMKLKSYWVPLLEDATKQIMDACRASEVHASGPVRLPTRKKLFCVLTSPHVNKDAREHFEIRTHSRLIDVQNPTTQVIDSLMALDLPAGVDVEVQLT